MTKGNNHLVVVTPIARAEARVWAKDLDDLVRCTQGHERFSDVSPGALSRILHALDEIDFEALVDFLKFIGKEPQSV